MPRHLSQNRICEQNTSDMRNWLLKKDNRSSNRGKTSSQLRIKEWISIRDGRINSQWEKLNNILFIHITQERQVMKSHYLNTGLFLEPPFRQKCRKVKSLSRVDPNSVISRPDNCYGPRIAKGRPQGPSRKVYAAFAPRNGISNTI